MEADSGCTGFTPCLPGQIEAQQTPKSHPEKQPEKQREQQPEVQQVEMHLDNAYVHSLVESSSPCCLQLVSWVLAVITTPLILLLFIVTISCALCCRDCFSKCLARVKLWVWTANPCPAPFWWGLLQLLSLGDLVAMGAALG